MQQWICIVAAVWMSAVAAGSLRADVNGDGRVDHADLAVFSEEWLMSENNFLQFNNGTLAVPNHAGLNVGSGDFSITLWVRTQDLVSGHLVAKQSILEEVVVGYRIFLSNNKVCADYGVSDSLYGLVQLGSAAAIDVNQWTLICLVATRYGGGELYIDGVRVFSESIDSEDSLDVANDLCIGSNSDGNFKIAAEIDSVRIYKKALTAGEVAAIYNEGTGTKYTAAEAEGGTAAAVFEFDEGTGTTTASTVLTDEAELTANFSETGIDWAEGGVPLTPDDDDNGEIEMAIDHWIDDLGKSVTLTNPYLRYVRESDGAARHKTTGAFNADSAVLAAGDAAHTLGDKVTTAQAFAVTLPDLPDDKYRVQLYDAVTPDWDDAKIDELQLYISCGKKTLISRAMVVPLDRRGRMR